MISLIQLYNEIRVNQPGVNFPLEIEKEDWSNIAKRLDNLGYTWTFGDKISTYNPFESNKSSSKIWLIIKNKSLKILSYKITKPL